MAENDADECDKSGLLARVVAFPGLYRQVFLLGGQMDGVVAAALVLGRGVAQHKLGA